MKTVKITYKTFEIVAVHNPKNSSQDIDGLYKHDSSQIVIKSTLSAEEKTRVLLHEITHALDTAFDIGLNETRVEKLAQAYATLFKDNPQLMHDLIDCKFEFDEEVPVFKPKQKPKVAVAATARKRKTLPTKRRKS